MLRLPPSAAMQEFHECVRAVVGVNEVRGRRKHLV